MLSLNEYRNDYRLTMNYQGVSRGNLHVYFKDLFYIKSTPGVPNSLKCNERGFL